VAKSWEPIVSPEHALLIVKERLREQQAEGVRMPERMPLDELALRVLIAQPRTLTPTSAGSLTGGPAIEERGLTGPWLSVGRR
jgi:hypothetical protein